MSSVPASFISAWETPEKLVGVLLLYVGFIFGLYFVVHVWSLLLQTYLHWWKDAESLWPFSHVISVVQQ